MVYYCKKKKKKTKQQQDFSYNDHVFQVNATMILFQFLAFNVGTSPASFGVEPTKTTTVVAITSARQAQIITNFVLKNGIINLMKEEK